MKDKITITVNKELLVWVDKNIKEYKFSSRSHAIEYSLFRLMQQS